MSARILPRPLADERGQSLVLTLLVLTVFAVSLGTVIFFTAGNQRNANYQKSAQVATSLAEAGINDGVSVLANPSNSCCLTLSTIMPSTLATAYSTNYTGGSVKWWGTVDSNWLWTLHSQATVANPTGPTASSIVKTMTAQVQVHAPKPGNFQVGVWNTVYSPFGPTAGCDTSIGQGVTINIPLYVGGNLCMSNNATVTKPVYVGGYLYFANKQASIGSSGATINSAHVGSYCQVQNSGTQVNPCKSEPVHGNQPDTNIWVTGAPNNLSGAASDFTGISSPVICWGPSTCAGDPVGGWYSVSSPGPLHPCTSVSGTPPTFDNNQTMDDSLQSTVFNLTPASSYTCKNAQGELSYNANTRTLTVAGTVFIDGSVTMTTSGNTPITYTGWGSGGACTNNGDCQAVIYASGDVSINSVKLCAVLNAQGSDCDWSNWNPNTKMLIFASNGPTGVTVGPTQTSFQGGLYATNTVSTGQGATTEGPLVSGSKTVVVGQQFGGTFPPITILPLSIQEAPQGFWVDPPTNFTYGG